MRGKVLLLASFLLLSFLVYRHALPVPLSSDARFLTYQNEYVVDPGGLARVWTADMFEGARTHGVTYRSGYYRPVMNTWFWLEYRWAGARDHFYNLSQILLHGVAAFLVALLVGRVAREGWAGPLAGLLFAAHPVNAFAATEPAARGDVLFALFYLAALLVFDGALLRTRNDGQWEAGDGADPEPGGRHEAPDLFRWSSWPWGSLTAVTLLYLASLLSKEMGATLPAVLVALVLLRWRRDGVPLRRVTWTLPAWTAFGAYLVWRFGFLDLPSFQAGYEAVHARGELLLAALKTVPIHLSRILVPTGPGYPELNPLLVNTVGEGLADPLAWVALTVTLAVVVGAALLWRRSPEFAFWCAFFALSFTPLLRVENIGGTLDTGIILTQERWIYLPAVAVVGAVASGGMTWLRRRGLLRTPRSRILLAGAGALAVTGLALLASVHAGKAEDPFARLRRLYLLPEESLSRFDRANRLLLYAHFVAVPRGEMEDAERRARRALGLVPDSPLSARSAAEILARRGEWNEVAALLRPWLSPDPEWLAEVARTNPRVFDDWNRVNPSVMLLMGRASAHLGRPEEAGQFLCEALRRGVPEASWRQVVREAPAVPDTLACG